MKTKNEKIFFIVGLMLCLLASSILAFVLFFASIGLFNLIGNEVPSNLSLYIVMFIISFIGLNVFIIKQETNDKKL